jgi:hypothetical protein
VHVALIELTGFLSGAPAAASRSFQTPPSPSLEPLRSRSPRPAPRPTPRPAGGPSAGASQNRFR